MISGRHVRTRHSPSPDGRRLEAGDATNEITAKRRPQRVNIDVDVTQEGATDRRDDVALLIRKHDRWNAGHVAGALHGLLDDHHPAAIPGRHVAVGVPIRRSFRQGSLDSAGQWPRRSERRRRQDLEDSREPSLASRRRTARNGSPLAIDARRQDGWRRETTRT